MKFLALNEIAQSIFCFVRRLFTRIDHSGLLNRLYRILVITGSHFSIKNYKDYREVNFVMLVLTL